MTMALSFSRPLQGMLSLLILRLLVRSLECQFFRSLPTRIMELYCLILWMSSWNSFILPPQVEEQSTTIKIGTLSPLHLMLAKIAQHNLWPIVRRSNLILKRAQFVYAICLRLPFCLCKHIMGIAHSDEMRIIPASPSTACSLKSFCS
jgi:hypothetical protein